MSRKLKAFTLVELLVVIGIISLLISILLPSLARARASAVTLQCLANVRSIGQALLLYSNDNKGYYPYGWAGIDDVGDGVTQRYWSGSLASYMNGLSYNPWDSAVNSRMAIFRCPEVSVPFSFPWTPACQYGSHPIVFASLWASPCVAYTPNPNRAPYIPIYKGTWLQKNGAEKAIIWDGTIMTDNNDVWGGSAFPGSCHVDSDRLWYGSGLLDAPGLWPSWHNNNEQVGLNGVFQDRPGNKADGTNSDTFRTRHNNNTACNFLFGDGHAETRTFSRQGESRDTGKSDMTHANFAVPAQHPGMIKVWF